MIELLTADTPNGKKISIMLEEIGLKYKVTKINIYKDEQFKPEFRKLSPFSKIPVIVDHDNNKEAIFESGAILIYLAEKTNKFYDKKERLKINQWLMIQMAIVGPFIGQHHQFHHYNSGKSKFGEDRYFKIAKRIYEDLDERLGRSEFLAGQNYTIDYIDPKQDQESRARVANMLLESRKKSHERLREQRLNNPNPS